MSLLPALFRNTDQMPMALGKKIETPAPKKPDPIAAFETGAHLPDGKVVEPWVEVVEPWRNTKYNEIADMKYKHDFLTAAIELARTTTKVPMQLYMNNMDSAIGERVPFGNPSRNALIEACAQYNEVKADRDPSPAWLADFFGLPKIGQMNAHQMEKLTAIVKDRTHTIAPAPERDHLVLLAQEEVRAAVQDGVPTPRIRELLECFGANNVKGLTTSALPMVTQGIRDLRAARASIRSVKRYKKG